ncbi:MAG: PA14 domain-containing protein, partial [Actinomycetota bacterium]|nr:PA14 domain-containing protein [Actinomycetota bacterium]
VRGGDLYVGGDFSHITSRDGVQRRRYGLARVDTATGALDGDWRPGAQGGGVRDLSIPPQGTRVYIGGIFPEVNNTSGTNQLAVVDDDTGDLLPRYDHGWPGTYVYTVSSTRTRAYVGGSPHRLEVRAPGGRTVKSFWADGNLQSSEVVGDTLYFGGHFESPGVIEDGDRVYHQRNHVGALDMANGDTLLPFYRDSAGPMGAWAIHGAPDGRLWYGGDVYRVGKGRVGGFARLSPVATRPGAGLYGRYFDDRRLQDLRWVSTDQTVDFDWGRRGPNRPAAGIDPPVDKNTFSVRWTGKVQPRFSGVYTFHTVSDDGVRLWVDGTRIINDWTRGGLRRNRGRIRLQAGQLYNIRLQYFEARGKASIRLLWSSDRQARQVIPRDYLYPQVAP